MPEFFDYDPFLGVKRYFDYDEQTGDAYIRTVHDAEPVLKKTLEMRNTGAHDSPKREFKLYAELTPVVQLELRKKGIDIYSKDPAMIKRMLHEINTNYPRLKATYKTHE